MMYTRYGRRVTGTVRACVVCTGCTKAYSTNSAHLLEFILFQELKTKSGSQLQAFLVAARQLLNSHPVDVKLEGNIISVLSKMLSF